MVESRPRSVMVVAHVPLAHEGRLIPGLLQILREEDRPLRLRPLVIDDAMVVHVLAGEDRSPARRA